MGEGEAKGAGVISTLILLRYAIFLDGELGYRTKNSLSLFTMVIYY